MENIIDPVDVALIKAELTESKKLRDTNKGGNVLYVLDAHDSPNTMREIGRLRELSFRKEGASSGLSMDIDDFDTMENPYKQLIVWNPDADEIIGGYRFILGPDVKIDADGQPVLATSHMFHFSEEFVNEYLPHVVELGRSFVTPDYQSSKAGAKALFALDNLWDGLGALMMQHPSIMYFFGKMTMYPSYDPAARDLIYFFLFKHFPDEDALVAPKKPVEVISDTRLLELIVSEKEFKDDYRLLKSAVMKLGTNIPPLVNSYMNTSPNMRCFGTGVNDEFCDALETAILVCFNDMYDDKRARHVDSFRRYKVQEARNRFPDLLPDFEDRLRDKWDNRRWRPRQKFLENRRRRKEAKATKV